MAGYSIIIYAKVFGFRFCGTFAEEIVELTDGFTGADLESTVRDLAYRSITNDNFVLNEEKYDMPKPMLRQPQTQTQSSTILNTIQNHQQKHTTQQMDKMRLDRLLRKTRSKRYMDALHELDAGGHTHNQNKVNEIIDAIRSEFPEIEISGILLGFVSICYLGKPYEVHTLDVTRGIIEHYKTGQALPNGLEKARGIAMRGGYDFIEVYIDCCRAISANGTVSVISC